MDDWENLCPLCILPMNEQDKQFKPCSCGYRMCVWCWQTIVTLAENDTGRCPNCREVFDLEAIAKQKARVSKPARKAVKERQQFADQVLFDRRVVGVRGLPTSLIKGADDLKKFMYFGQYGRIVSCFVPADMGTAVIRFTTADEAATCVSCTNGSMLGGDIISAALVQVRYCSNFLKNTVCTKKFCVDVHVQVTDKNQIVAGQSAATIPIMGVVPSWPNTKPARVMVSEEDVAKADISMQYDPVGLQSAVELAKGAAYAATPGGSPSTVTTSTSPLKRRQSSYGTDAFSTPSEASVLDAQLLFGTAGCEHKRSCRQGLGIAFAEQHARRKWLEKETAAAHQKAAKGSGRRGGRPVAKQPIPFVPPSVEGSSKGGSLMTPMLGRKWPSQ